MIHSLHIVHRLKPARFSGEMPPGWALFSTCLRSLAIGFSDWPGSLENTDQVMKGSEAYRFLLEVLCGLHSPIVGETEVFGQFRLFAENQKVLELSLLQQLYSDVKLVRMEHLSHLGSQSYGSWVRKRSAGARTMALVGTGHLAKEIFQWMKKENVELCFFSRDAKKARLRLQAELAGTDWPVPVVKDLAELAAHACEVLVIASPVEASEIPHSARELVIDLRDTAGIDVLPDLGRIALSDIFSEIESVRSEVAERVTKAKVRLKEITERRFKSQTIRPFGWDDLCA